MSKGVLYLMSTVVDGLVKIGKTGNDNFNNRMRDLESNGYRNVTGLKREFAIEVEDYDEKEKLLHEIFEKTRVGDTELFAIPLNTAKRLMSALDGRQIHPVDGNKDDFFDNAAIEHDIGIIPDGLYHIRRFKRSENRYIDVRLRFENKHWICLKGSVCGVRNDKPWKRADDVYDQLKLDDRGVLLEDYDIGICAPSTVAHIVLRMVANGWDCIRDGDNKPISRYRSDW